MNAADVMSRTVIAINEDAPLSQAVRLMLDGRVSGMPVLDKEGRPVGVLTEGDLLRRAETGTAGDAPGWFASVFRPGRLAEDYIRTHGRRVGEVMTPKVITIDEDTPLAEIAQIMERQRIKRLPVVRDGKVVGIVSRADLLRPLAEKLRETEESPSDAAIRARFVEELARQPWAHRRGITVEVVNGVVLLDGCVFDLRERDAMQVAAENIPGVKRVENRLVCIEPNTGALIYAPDDESPGEQPSR
ncbi:MAG TPA: CBS domain-containing protein [Acetobacteraceae bacterium]|nr:CBS domain-containing protein [Acetobacteraceae bacterium]